MNVARTRLEKRLRDLEAQRRPDDDMSDEELVEEIRTLVEAFPRDDEGRVIRSPNETAENRLRLARDWVAHQSSAADRRRFRSLSDEEQIEFSEAAFSAALREMEKLVADAAAQAECAEPPDQVRSPAHASHARSARLRPTSKQQVH